MIELIVYLCHEEVKYVCYNFVLLKRLGLPDQNVPITRERSLCFPDEEFWHWFFFRLIPLINASHRWLIPSCDEYKCISILLFFVLIRILDLILDLRQWHHAWSDFHWHFEKLEEKIQYILLFPCFFSVFKPIGPKPEGFTRASCWVWRWCVI